MYVTPMHELGEGHRFWAKHTVGNILAEAVLIPDCSAYRQGQPTRWQLRTYATSKLVSGRLGARQKELADETLCPQAREALVAAAVAAGWREVEVMRWDRPTRFWLPPWAA
jgi:hypothetical protein